MVSFINNEIAMSVLQTVEIQVKAYQKFCELLGDKKEARIQTEIYMRMFRKNSEADENAERT